MGILEGILYTLWRGLAIGIIISAPMGPVGILCVQRTLDKGRKTGLYTGVGAALSDLIYCLLTGFGLSFIEEFLERNSNIIQLVGSLVLIGFGIYLFKSNPSRKLRKPTDQHIPAGKNIMNGFLFTVSNPLIIFLIIGLFARFNFLLPEIRFYHYIIGFIAIFVGALGWWYLVTFFVDKVRAHFNLRSMWLINKIIGGVIFLFAIVGIITAISGLANAARPTVYMNSSRGFHGFKNAVDSALVIENKNDKALSDLISLDKPVDMTWEFRARNLRPGSPGWGVVMKSDTSTTVISFATCDNRFDETYSSPHVEMRIKIGGKDCGSKKLFSNFNLTDGENAFRISSGKSGWRLYAGDRTYRLIAESDKVPTYIDSIGYIVYPGGKITVDNMSVETSGSSMSDISYGMEMDEASIRSVLHKSYDKMTGEWAVFDRMLEDNYLRLGGDYRLAIVKNADGYDILYLGGAEKNPTRWRAGMKKGRLIAGPFKDVYDMEWIDVSGKTIRGLKAQYEEPLLRVIFPEMSSELRLGKVQSSAD